MEVAPCAWKWHRTRSQRPPRMMKRRHTTVTLRPPPPPPTWGLTSSGRAHKQQKGPNRSQGGRAGVPRGPKRPQEVYFGGGGNSPKRLDKTVSLVQLPCVCEHRHFTRVFTPLCDPDMAEHLILNATVSLFWGEGGFRVSDKTLLRGTNAHVWPSLAQVLAKIGPVRGAHMAQQTPTTL